MDVFNNISAQIRDVFASMTAGARITAALLLAVVVVSLGYLFQQGTASGDAYLFGGEYLPASQLDRIEMAIAKRNLSGHIREGNRIRVPAGQKHEYLAAIAEDGATPRNFHDLLENSLNQGGMWESREARRERLRIAKAATLSEIVRAMDWVEEAVVIYDVEAQSGWNRPKQVTGSVNVQPMVGESLTFERKKALQRLVAHSVVGLSPDAVAVTSLRDDAMLAGSEIAPEEFDNEYLRARAKFNQYQRDAIVQVLNYIPGVRVQVNAELDNMSQDVTRNVKPEEKTALLLESGSEDKTDRTTTDNGGRPGVEAQGPYRAQDEGLAKVDKDSTKSRTFENQYSAGYADQQIRKAGFVPTAVWATVAVPRNYLADVWRQRNPVAEGQTPREPEQQDLDLLEAEVKREVENLVNQILPGHIEGEDSYKYVAVEFVDSITPPPILGPSVANQALAWTGRNWSTLTLVCFAMVSLLMLRKVATTPPPSRDGSAPALALDMPGDADQPGADGEDGEDDGAPKLRLNKGPTLKDDLLEMVREDPDAAAAILRSWINKAA